MTFSKNLNLLLSDLKRTSQIFFKYGKYHYRESTYKGYTQAIESNFENNKLDFDLLYKFSQFCIKEGLYSQAITFLLKIKNKFNAIEICNYFLIQQYGKSLHERNNYETKGVILSLLKESMYNAFGKDYFDLLAGKISVFPKEVKSEFVLMEMGLENFGYIRHEIESVDKKYLTKINISLLKNSELPFYHDIREIFPTLQKITPGIIGSITSKSGLISCMIIEYGEGVNTDYTKLDKIIKCHKEFIQVCTYTPTVSKKLKKPFELGYSYTYLPRSFSRIHKELYYKQVIEWNFNTLKLDEYRPELKFLLGKFFEKMNEANFYQYVFPDRHYSLCHGDFNLNNILYRPSIDQLNIIDWSHCTFGPKLIDFAMFFRISHYSYQAIYDFFLEDVESSSEYDDIDSVLFLFSAITISMMMQKKKFMNDDPDKFFRPAVNKCLELIDRIEANRIGYIKQTLY